MPYLRTMPYLRLTPCPWRTVLVALAVAAFVAALPMAGPASAQPASLHDVVSSVVRIKTFINPDGRTRENLGRDREGSGIVIDDGGLVLTIGYLMVEAHAVEVTTVEGRTVPADVVGYDHDTGFGLVRAVASLKVKPLPFGRSADVKTDEPLIVAGYGGVERAAAVRVAAKREFAGYWEYLLEDAIFTSPPYPAWSGAALVNRDGRLVGVGSLIVGDTTGKGREAPGNMFVPIDLLPPILADLIADGKPATPPRPWLGITTEEHAGVVMINRVTAGAPADKGGLQRGDMVVGIDGVEPKSVADFYRKIWARGEAGVTVPLDVMRDGEKRRIEVKSMNRLDHLRLKSTF
jgi:S1-C subfamily serine protease